MSEVDYNKVAADIQRALRASDAGCTTSAGPERRIWILQATIDAAIALCEDMAAGKLVERERVWSWTTPDGRYVLSRKQGPGPTDPTSAKDNLSKTGQSELEHCERVAEEMIGSTANYVHVDIIARERAAADKAGYERRGAEGWQTYVAEHARELADRDRRIAELEREAGQTETTLMRVRDERDGAREQLRQTTVRLDRLVEAAERVDCESISVGGGVEEVTPRLMQGLRDALAAAKGGGK